MHIVSGAYACEGRSRTSESPGYWLVRHMSRCARGKDQHRPGQAQQPGSTGPGTTPPRGGNRPHFTQLHLLSYGYIL
ncbi:hypothetical protein C1J00_41340 [Streptomyces cahuitamycinicus]|uniref:Uncharacterized protein n=1 Tax=Streptomyces cahuitamycinicus TaxID=2070367 RepID=A0A2N8TC03_9ACTN|nr:hypothetical protein C1J00_41340 [Streptomyces cahuitamycinicus]